MTLPLRIPASSIFFSQSSICCTKLEGMCAPPDVELSHVRYWTTVSNSTLEIVLLSLLWLAALSTQHAVEGSTMRLSDLALISTLTCVVRRAYTWHLENMYFRFPKLRTQPAKKAVGPESKDVTGRTRDELSSIDFHDRLTLISHFAMDLFFYFAMAKTLYPPVETQSTWTTLARLVGHHYVLSFGMYWVHRNLHTNQFLWKHIHSLHHYAKTPLARATYEDHWLDNLANALVSEIAAQILLPLPREMLFVSRILRVCESLEKHSGMSGPVNVVHAAQYWLPFSQQPHHHDHHHEGHKGSNYTFASLGGVWDFLFGTRHPGRSGKDTTAAAKAATYHDKTQRREAAAGLRRRRTSVLDNPYVSAIPVLAYAAATVYKAKYGSLPLIQSR